MKKIVIFGLGAIAYAFSNPLAQAEVVIQPTLEIGEPVVEPQPYVVSPIVVDHHPRDERHHRYDWGYWHNRPAPHDDHDRDHRR